MSEQETPDGLVVEFVNAGRVDEVRKRMRARAGFAKAHPRPMPAQMTRELEDTPNGIRMTVHSTDPAKVDVVRKMVRDQIKQAQRQAAHS